jgi:hypothetical protein
MVDFWGAVLSTDVSLLFRSRASRASLSGGAIGIHDSLSLIGLFIHEAEDALLGLLREEGPVVLRLDSTLAFRMSALNSHLVSKGTQSSSSLWGILRTGMIRYLR